MMREALEDLVGKHVLLRGRLGGVRTAKHGKLLRVWQEADGRIYVHLEGRGVFSVEELDEAEVRE